MAQVIQYADKFQPDFGIPWTPVLSSEQLAKMSVPELEQYLAARQHVERMAEESPVACGWTLPMWKRVQENWKKYNIHVMLGGNQCVRGDTKIFDPVLGEERRIDSIKGKHHVWAFDGLDMVIAEAEEPFQKGVGAMVEVCLSTGHRFVASPDHWVLDASGRWLSVSQLRVGCGLYHPQSSLDTYQSTRDGGGQRCCGTASDSQSGYRPALRLCGEQPHAEAGSAQDASPSQDDAPRRTELLESICRLTWQRGARLSVGKLGALGDKPECVPTDAWYDLLASLDDLQRLAVRSSDTEYRASYRLCKSASQLLAGQATWQESQRFAAGFGPRQSTDEFDQPDNLFGHGVAYVTSLTPVETNVKWDMLVPTHHNYLASGVIQHNSGKTVFGSRLTVWAAGTIPQAETYCFHVSEKRSIDDQQRFIYEALPQSIKSLPTKKGISHSTTYSQKNGFTDSICILPPHEGYHRGGSINFFNYAQYAQNDQIIEGIKAHFLWLDEKVPLALLETLKYRLFTYRGRMLLSYTVIDGWNDTIEKILAKTKTLESRWSDKLKRKLPVVQESLSMESCCIYYAWTDDNPFTDAKEFWKLNANADEPTILARAYGIPTKSLASAFPLFSRDVNVVPHDSLPFVKDPDYPVTRYMAIDPGGSKNWFMVWVAIDASNTWWIYREWPDYDDWALPGNKNGPAQRGLGKGIKDYVELIKGLEGSEQIYERIIDPRMGAAERQSQDGATTIISDLDEADMTVIPAPGGSDSAGKSEIEDGIQLINNLLAWDQAKPRDSVNSPRLYVSDRCQNVIYALQEYTGKLGQTESTKDCVDGIRYLVKASCEFYGNLKPDTDNRTGVY